MELYLSDKKGVPIQKDMIGLFFEDINYAADGGLYAEMIENRSFEFLDCYGTVGDYYTKHDPGYAWEPTQEYGQGRMEYVMGSPLDRANPHYLRFTAGSSSFRVEYAGNSGNDWFFKVYAVGNAGDGCGFYVNGAPFTVAVAHISE